ncbi:MAG: hypothetical protein IKM59_01740 [Oscillospiraceae bacterium]|nr:hypothetical protein [Oscillospiraceae bacterium]
MKRVSLWVLVFLLMLCATGCAVGKLMDWVTAPLDTPADQVAASLGEYEKEGFWTHGGFQDFTDFGIYTYSSVSLGENSYFSPVTGEDMDTVRGFIDNYETWIDTFRRGDPQDELVSHYAFDFSVIDPEDLFYLDYEESSYSKYVNYDLWIFDSQSKTLYYFHNNI